LRVEDAGESREAREWIDGHLTRRLELNALILEYAATKQLIGVDLFAATADMESRLLAREYSNDGLHLTTDGYRRFAELVCGQVLAPVLTSGN
jgi:lysophospholipase L1-like esterase